MENTATYSSRKNREKPALFSMKTYRMTLLILVSMTMPVVGRQALPQVSTNQTYVEQLLSPASLNVSDASSVMSYILNSLLDEVVVYPTENYYYFSFYQGGLKYTGNLRLDASDRNSGKIHISYFRANTEWGDTQTGISKTFSQKDGLAIVPVGRLRYRVTFRGRSVLFKLNDLSRVQPPTEILAAGEEYIGPVFDESATQFFLIYKKATKGFLYVLNEINKNPDVLVSIKTHPRLRLAQRTGFVFYQDHFTDRLILVGVFERNVVLNNYFDGPFDQLPDNFINGDSLKAAFIDQNPERAGTIDRFGKLLDSNNRISISPYLNYLSLDELYGFDECAQKYRALPEKYYTCFDAGNLSNE